MLPSVKGVIKAEFKAIQKKFHSAQPKTVVKTSMASAEAIVCIKCTFALVGMLSNPISATFVLIACLAVTAVFITFTVKALNLFIPNSKTYKPPTFLLQGQPLPPSKHTAPTPPPPVATHLPETPAAAVPAPEKKEEPKPRAEDALAVAAPAPKSAVAPAPAALQPRNPIADIPEECLPYYLELPEMTDAQRQFITETVTELANAAKDISRCNLVKLKDALFPLLDRKKALKAQRTQLLAGVHELQSLDFLLSTPENRQILFDATNNTHGVPGFGNVQESFLEGQLAFWNTVLTNSDLIKTFERILPGFAHSTGIPYEEIQGLIDQHFTEQRSKRTPQNAFPRKGFTELVYKQKLELKNLVAFVNAIIELKKQHPNTPQKFPKADIEAFVRAKQEEGSAKPARDTAPPPPATPPAVIDPIVPAPAPAALESAQPGPADAAPEPSSDDAPTTPNSVAIPVNHIEKAEASVSVTWTVDMIKKLPKETRQDIAKFLDRRSEVPKEGKTWKEPRGSFFHEDHVTFRAQTVASLLNTKYKDEYKFENGIFTDLRPPNFIP